MSLRYDQRLTMWLRSHEAYEDPLRSIPSLAREAHRVGSSPGGITA